MAPAPVLCDFDLTLAHVDKNLDARFTLRTARHPSETLERVWLRALAYCLHYEERLTFGAGLSDPDAPDIEARDLTGALSLWVFVGKPDPARVQKVADQNGRARVAVLFESAQRLAAFRAAAASLPRLARVELAALDPALPRALAEGDERRAKASVTIVGDHFYVEKAGRTFDAALSR